MTLLSEGGRVEELEIEVTVQGMELARLEAENNAYRTMLEKLATKFETAPHSTSFPKSTRQRLASEIRDLLDPDPTDQIPSGDYETADGGIVSI